jgi:hypothetical protein
LLSLSLSRNGGRPQRTKMRNKKVIGSRYKGKFLRSLNRNLNFSTVLIGFLFDGRIVSLIFLSADHRHLSYYSEHVWPSSNEFTENCRFGKSIEHNNRIGASQLFSLIYNNYRYK